MPKEIEPKCQAMTMKHTNSKRPIEEISQCTRFVLENSRFCKNHQNLHELTDEQFKNNTKICRQCRKHKYFSDMNYKVCDDDREHGVEKRDKQRAEKIIYPPCVICSFTGGNERKYPNYCNKHVTDGFKADIVQRGLKWCKGIIRGCLNPTLPKDYPYEKCEACRHKENEQDNKRSETKLEESIKQIEHIQQNTNHENPKKIQIKIKSKIDKMNSNTNKDQLVSISNNQETFNELNYVSGGCSSKIKPVHDFDHIYMIDNVFHKICSSPKHHCPHPLEEFFTEKGSEYYTQRKTTDDDLYDIIVYMVSHNMITRQCYEIRKCQRVQDQKRNCTDQGDILLEKKQEVKDYIELDSEEMRVYRKMNPEKCVRAYRGSIKSSNRKICECRRSGKKRDIPYELTIEETKQLINDKCFYCGCQPIDCQFNGIDRLDHNKSYVFENCVTSCSMCNYMKACHDPLVFIDICEHILTHLGKINGNLHPQLFMNFNAGKSVNFLYEEYKRSADKRKYEWSLSIDDVAHVIDQPCYLCGKLKTHDHINGIDRYDNTKGYIILNIRPCCGTCNYMKRDIEYNVFFNTLVKIHANRELILSKLLPK